MKLKIVISMAIMLMISFAYPSMCSADGITGSYWYDSDMNAIEVPDAYIVDDVLELKKLDNTYMTGLTDLFISTAGDLYALDSETGEITIYDQSLSYVKTLSKFKTAANKPLALKEPDGIFVSKDGYIYIADTKNNRVLLTDSDGNNTTVFEYPKGVEEFKAKADYLPQKIVVDESGRMFVTARSVVNGILALTRNGDFITYIGAPPVTLDPLTTFWRKFSTQAQLDRMIDYIPTEYSNLQIDASGFIYGSISAISEEDASTINPVRKINSVGQDILRTQGVIGDTKRGAHSQMLDVALGDYGTYFLLDGKAGRIFSYDSNGNMLFAFGGLSDIKGNFKQPVSLGYYNKKLYVLDTNLSQIIVFKLTEYGETLFGAIKEEDSGNFDKSFEEWKKVFEINPGFDLAYIGVGNLYLKQGDYRKSMEFFRLADYMTGYSKSYELYRKENMKILAPAIFAAIVSILLLALLVNPVKSLIRYCRN